MISNSRKDKAVFLSSPLSEESQHSWSEAIHTYKPSGINFSTPSTLQAKHMGEGEKEAAKGQHRFPQLPLYDAGFTFCISDITGAVNQSRVSKSDFCLGAFKV